MRVLATTDAVGGVWTYSLDLARGLAAENVETVLATVGPPPSLDQVKAAKEIEGLKLVRTGIELDWMAEDEGSIRDAGATLARLADRHKADLVQLNAPAFAADAAFDQPVVAVSHSCLTTWWAAVKKGEPDRLFRWRGELTGRGLRAADRVVTPTAAFAKATQEAHALDETPAAVHNGRTPLPTPEVAPHDFAFTAGRLWDKGKNAATVDLAAARLPVPLYAAGPTRGPNGDSIFLEHAHSLGLLSETELARWLAARPVFVSAALYEPFGLTALEAAAAGCPLVLSDIPTFRELWDGAATFIDPMDEKGFGDAVCDIIGDDFLRSSLGGAAKERARRYTPEAMAAKMAAIYRDLTAAAPSADKVAA